VGSTHPKYLHEAPKPTYYLPMSQRPRPAAWTILMIRTAPGAVHPGPAIAKVVRDEFEYVALTEMMPFSEQVRRNTSEQRLSADLSLAVAALGLLLAVVGLGSVLGYAVLCRKPEIGLRMALGATAENVRAMIAREAARMVIAGLVLGGLGSFGLGRLLESQLHGLVGLADVPTLVMVPAVLLAAALAAAWLPAHRAASVDPAAALQDE
jgi:ABC-type lipoprotein release transport system permease subunit